MFYSLDLKNGSWNPSYLNHNRTTPEHHRTRDSGLNQVFSTNSKLKGTIRHRNHSLHLETSMYFRSNEPNLEFDSVSKGYDSTFYP